MSNKNFKKTVSAVRRGFTLIELSLVVAIVVLIGGISAPVYQNFQVRNNIDLAVEDAVHALRRAQILSQSGEGDSTWGVYISTGNITIFKGASFAARDVSFDEVFEFPPNMTTSGTSELVYSKMYGDPQSALPATITFTSINGDSRDVFINSEGMIEY